MINPIKCDQCNPLMINKIFTHETGCSNEKKRWDTKESEWYNVYECDICGFEVKEGETCSCYEESE